MKKISLYIVFFLPLMGAGQTTMTLKSAIDTMLLNSFDIRIARNIVGINKVNNTFGVAGGLPSVNASVTDNESSTNVNQKLNSGVEIKKSGASGNTMNSSLAVGMVLFNGFKVMAAKGRLNYLQKQRELEFNLQIQNSIASVMDKYYDLL